ncbi:sulfatase [Paludisphaera borealis]|uniref:Arylsulfatase n=1 Tax=Paludisphaera borealis TaxID=1387353 RepID=A0A1U7CST0_9BACT|nr:sulfatase [Paludisphaera borealis]APW61997.1 Arylsulfatase [Paludisphaera borealis]
MKIRPLLVMLIAASAQSAAAAAEKPPNVVLIISDDHAWTDYSFNGHPHIRTPHIDGLAAQGLTYRRGYVPSSLCSPSLASILTGRYAHQHKVTSNDPPLPPGKTGKAAYDDAAFRGQRKEMVGFIESIPTIPRQLAQRGYVSFESGKWWGGNYKSGGFTSGMTHGDPDHGGRHGDVGLTIGRETMKPVFDFIDESTESGKPFFLWYAPMMPHQPHNPPARLLDKHQNKAPSLDVAKYWAMVEWFDETCGQLLDHLDAKGVAKDTLVVYLSDNGWIQDPAAPRYAPRSKQSQYDGGLRTPIILRWPGKIQPGESDRLASSIDLAPTILAAADLKPAPEMQGVNLLDASAVKAREAIFGEIFTHNAVDIHRPSTSLRYRWTIAGDWKLILPARQNEPDAPIELYNLAADPAESKNLAEQNSSKVAELRRLITNWWTPG